MSGAKNCPETPRQKMIAMMYLVLTAMLALNVSADILKGFTMVNQSLLTTIESTDQRNKIMMENFKELNHRNPEKIKDWLDRAVSVQQKSNELFDYISNFKYEMIKLADRKVSKENINQYEIENKGNVEAASNYGLTQGKGKELKGKIDDYRKFVIDMFNSGDDPEIAKEKADDYNKLFNTDDAKSTIDKSKTFPWEVLNFESMPLAAAVTMLTKLQSDIKNTESELIQFLKSSTDAKDFRVNDIRAVVIPDARTVVAGTSFRAQIMLAARDTTVHPDIMINGTKVTDPNGWLNLGAGSVGTHQLIGTLSFADPITNQPRSYTIKDEYAVVPPSATVANQDMNVVYMGYANRMSVSAPGFSSDKLTVTATNANIERSGEYYICRPSSYDGVTINVFANVEGKQVSMGSQKFRVKALPNPTVFLRYTNVAGDRVTFNPVETPGIKPKRSELLGAEVIAEYADGLLQANFSVQSFVLYVDDGRGGWSPTVSDGKNFSASQKSSLQNLKTGSKIILDKVKVTGAKTVTLSFPLYDLP